MLYPSIFVVLILALIIFLSGHILFLQLSKKLFWSKPILILALAVGIVLSIFSLTIARERYAGSMVATDYGYPHNVTRLAVDIDTGKKPVEHLFFTVPAFADFNFIYFLVNTIFYTSAALFVITLLSALKRRR